MKAASEMVTIKTSSPPLLCSLLFLAFHSYSSSISLHFHILPASQINLRCLWKIIIIDCSAVAHQHTHAHAHAHTHSQ